MDDCDHSIIKYIPRPDTPHKAEMRCSKCDKFLGWQKSSNDGKKYRKQTKYEPKDIMNYKGYNDRADFCFFCGRIASQLGKNECLTIDHIIPVRAGGLDIPLNIQILCTSCHRLRHWAENYLNLHFVEI